MNHKPNNHFARKHTEYSYFIARTLLHGRKKLGSNFPGIAEYYRNQINLKMLVNYKLQAKRKLNTEIHLPFFSPLQSLEAHILAKPSLWPRTSCPNELVIWTAKVSY